MSHLTPERIAALSDDTPSPIEAAHITTCPACTDELAAQRKLSRLAVEASMSFGPPSSRFDALVPRLRAEGLIEVPDHRVVMRRWALRAAAAIAFMTVGAVGGRLSAGLRIVGTGDQSPVTMARNASFQTQDDAVQALQASQEAYQNAAAYLAAQDTTQHFIGLGPDSYRTRLAALDEMTAASRAALYRAPQDPLLNQYYLTLQTAREQTLRALAVSLPANRPLGRY